MLVNFGLHIPLEVSGLKFVFNCLARKALLLFYLPCDTLRLFNITIICEIVRTIESMGIQFESRRVVEDQNQVLR